MAEYPPERSTPEQIIRNRIDDILEGAAQRKSALAGAWLRIEEELACGRLAQQQFLLDNLGRMMHACIEYDERYSGIFDNVPPAEADK